MDAHILNSSEHRSAPTPDIDGFLATPAIWLPGMDDGDWQSELDAMMHRAKAAQLFVSGQLSPEDFEEALFEGGYDPCQCDEDWQEGRGYLC